MNPKQNNSLTHEHLALQNFTNRHQFIKQFVKSLNDEPPPTQILFFHGDGGNGKTLLLKFLREKCCKRLVPAIWQQLKNQSDDRLIATLEQDELKDYTAIPSAVLDFGQPPIDEDQPQDRFYGLLTLRRHLAIDASQLGCQLKFPRYDFACAWYLRQKGKSLAEIHRFFPPEEMELIGILVDAMANNVGANLFRAILNSIAKHFGEKLSLFWQNKGLDKQFVTRLKAMALETELIDTLPHWFAQDLNAIMKNGDILKRIVLFFDTHEAFWGYERCLPEERFFYRDEWLRRLLGELDLSTGIIVVIAGRERPRWAESPKFPISPEKVNTQLVWHLSETDAKVYLQNVAIFDADLQQAVIKYASIEPNQVYPFFLSLCADEVLAAQRRGIVLGAVDFTTISEINVKSRELVHRLLRDVNKDIEYAIQALSACRTFDRELYFILGSALHFNATSPTFNIITQFSFVWPDERKNHYHIHHLLRRLYNENNNPIVNEAHEVLEKYYRDKENKAEAIYHAICHDWQRGVDEWIEVHDEAQQQEDFELCRILQEIREETHLHWDKSHNR